MLFIKNLPKLIERRMAHIECEVMIHILFNEYAMGKVL